MDWSWLIGGVCGAIGGTAAVTGLARWLRTVNRRQP
jgi:hypothetical protein